MDVDSYYLEQDERMGMESEEQDEIMESLSSFARCLETQRSLQQASYPSPKSMPDSPAARLPSPAPRGGEKLSASEKPPSLPSAPKTGLDISVNDSIQEFDATNSPETLAKALPNSKEPAEERKAPPRTMKRRIDAPATSTPPQPVQESPVSDDITSFSIVEERPRKRLRTLAMIGVKPKKTAPKKLAKLHTPASPRKQPPSSDVATSPIEEPSTSIGNASAGNSTAAAKPKRGSLLTALEERIACAKSSGSLAPQATLKRPADEPAEASGSKTKRTKESKKSRESKKDKESSRRHDSSRSKHTKSEQQQQQPPPQPKPAPPPIPTTYAECVRQKKKEIRPDMKQNIFTGMDVFLVIDDEDMEDVEAKVLCLVRCGARLMERYIPDKCTHIICASDKTLHPSLFYKLQVTSVDEVPEHIPILNWKFVLKCITKYNKEEGPIIKARQEKADLEWRGLKRKNPAPELVPLEDRPQGFFLPPQEEWPKYSACPWRGTGAAQAVGGESRQRASSYASSEASESGYSSPSRATSEAASGAEDAPEGKIDDREADPLVPFYDQAKDDRAKEYEEEHGFPPPDLWDLKPDEDDDEDLDVPVVGEKGDQYDRTEETEDEKDVEDSPVKKGKKGQKGQKGEGKRKFACDTVPAPGPQGPCPNQDVIDILTKLQEIHKIRAGIDDKFKVLSYSKSLRNIRAYPTRIRTKKEAMKIHGVGAGTADKIMEIIETGTLRRLMHELTPDVAVLWLFKGIYGVGTKTAQMWYNWGCRTLEDVMNGKGGVKLNPGQKIGIKYYADLQERMPREEVKALYDLIVPYGKRVDPKLELYVMGSYRRGKKNCGDIDIMITRPTDDGGTHAGAMHELLKYLRRADIITEDLAVPEDPYDPECVYHGLCHLPKTPGAKQRRIDFLAVPWKSKGAALIYYTGDDIFNRAMRYKANIMGYSLNQKGLYAGVVRDVHDRTKKLNQGSIIASETEEEIFKILGVPWQEPCQRVRNI